jgi:hypothetical protein
MAGAAKKTRPGKKKIESGEHGEKRRVDLGGE